MADSEAWLVRTEARSPSPQTTVTPHPPPAFEVLDAAADELLSSGAWKRAFDPVTGSTFFFDAQQPLRRTWNLRSWIECQMVSSELNAFQVSPARPDAPDIDDWKQKIVALYTQHNPTKLLVVDELLARYQGREAELWRNLMSKYGGPWSPTAVTPARPPPPTQPPMPSQSKSKSKSPIDNLESARQRSPVTMEADTNCRHPDRPLSPREMAELKARALLNGLTKSTSSHQQTVQQRQVATPTPRTSSPRAGTKSPRPTPRVRSPATDRIRSPANSRAKSPAVISSGSTTREDEWADDLARRRTEVVARREALANQRREARERREAQVAQRAELLRQRTEPTEPRVSPIRTTSASRVVRDRVSLIERQASAAELLRLRVHSDTNRGHDDFDTTSPMTCKGWKTGRQIEYRPKPPPSSRI